MEAKSKMYSVAQIATKAGVSRIYVQKAIERERLRATKIGKQWIVLEEDYLDWEKSRKNYSPQQGA